MIELTAYTIENKVYTSTRTIIYTGKRKSDRLPVIIKTLQHDYPTTLEIEQIVKEYHILGKFDSEHVIKAIDLQYYNNKPVLILEDFGGISLRKQYEDYHLSYVQFLQIAIQMTGMLEAIHCENIIHKDINPSNILYNNKAGQVKLIDFGIASQLPLETQAIISPDKLEGTLPYISPEQTGRMNRPIDYRTDYYSLGATLYTLLTGQHPFISDDPMELIHCHIAKIPPSAHTVDSSIPLCISDFIGKLLAKTAEDRYQSTYGIKHDLELCIKEVENKTDKRIKLGTFDISGKFQIPDKVYGRDREVNALLGKLDRTVAGSKELFFLGGEPGIGKSAIVNEIHKNFVQSKGYFCSGKYDQYKKDTPYSAVIRSISDLVKQILMESNQALAEWKKVILEAVGSNGNVIIEVIPELELIIGSQPALDFLPPSESQNRFIMVFVDFIKAITARQIPLILFLDDLQWADSGSFYLLQTLLTDVEVQYFLFIGAYRDNEIDEGHSLTELLEALQTEKINFSTLAITPLNSKHVQQMVSDTLSLEAGLVFELSQMVCQKTDCNPFFLKLFLKKLYSDNLIEFVHDKDNPRWVWNLQKIESAHITDNVAELMTERLGLLDEAGLECMKIASTFGQRFLIEDFIAVYGKSEDETFEALSSPYKEGLFIKDGDYIKFIHDRVQESAYCSLTEQEREQLHYKIGTVLLKKAGQPLPDSVIFDILVQFNQAAALLTADEKNLMTQLNLKAGRIAQNSGAYQSALVFLQKAIDLLPEKGWETAYDMTFEIYLELSQVEYLNRHFDKAEELFEYILGQAKNILDEIKVYSIKIRHYIPQGKPMEAIQIMYTALEKLGLPIPAEITQDQLGQEVGRVQSLLAGRRAAELVDLPDMSDEKQKAKIEIMMHCLTAAITFNPPLASVISLRVIALTLEHGITPMATNAFSSYGILLTSVFGDFQNGIEFGELALTLSDKTGSKLIRSFVYFAVYFTIWHFKVGMKENLEYIPPIISLAKDAGSFEIQGYIFSFYLTFQLLAAVNLRTIDTKYIQKYKSQVYNLKQYQTTIYFDAFSWCIYNLSGQTEQIGTLKSTFLTDDAAIISEFKKANSFTGLTTFYIVKIITAVIMRDYNNLSGYLTECEKTIDTMFGLPQYITFHFYLGIGLSVLFMTAEDEQKAGLAERITGLTERFKMWGEANRKNYLNKYYFLKALKASIDEESFETVIALYNQAISTALDNQFAHEAALASEYAAFYCIEKGYENFAKSYMTDAYYNYIRWGSVSKRKQLEENYAHLIYQVSSDAPDGLQGTLGMVDDTISSTETGISSKFDLASIVKASNTLSRAIKLDELLAKMMKVVIENAGAQKGYFLLFHDNSWYIEAEGYVDREDVEVLQSIQLSPDNDQIQKLLPVRIIHYVERTKAYIVLPNAQTDGDFTGESYILENNIKSLLCMPLLNQGRLTGILYLENNLSIGAFTQHRLEVIKTLSSQIAISIENARMYKDLDDLNKNLEEKVAERTRQLSDANKEIVSSITYAKKIQLAILPKEEDLKQTLYDHFVFYKPLNIVGGDFYWFEKVEKGFFISVIDCTGHGVPGAFMSMMGRSILNHVISHMCPDNPSVILQEVNRLVKQILSQYTKESTTDDGMDAGICYIAPEEHKLIYAGARLPLFYCRNNECIEVRGDKMSLGYTRSLLDFQFTNHHIELTGDEVFYLTSDGIIDQSGGPKGIGFGRKRMRELLALHSGKALSEQKLNIEEALAKYQGDKLQRDDITIIGFKL